MGREERGTREPIASCGVAPVLQSSGLFSSSHHPVRSILADNYRGGLSNNQLW